MRLSSSMSSSGEWVVFGAFGSKELDNPFPALYRDWSFAYLIMVLYTIPSH